MIVHALDQNGYPCFWMIHERRINVLRSKRYRRCIIRPRNHHLRNIVTEV